MHGGKYCEPGKYYVNFYSSGDTTLKDYIYAFYIDEPEGEVEPEPEKPAQTVKPTGGTKFASYQGYDFYRFSDGNVKCYKSSNN